MLFKNKELWFIMIYFVYCSFFQPLLFHHYNLKGHKKRWWWTFKLWCFIMMWYDSNISEELATFTLKMKIARSFKAMDTYHITTHSISTWKTTTWIGYKINKAEKVFKFHAMMQYGMALRTTDVSLLPLGSQYSMNTLLVRL